MLDRSQGQLVDPRELDELRTFALSSSGRSVTNFSSVLAKCSFATRRSGSHTDHWIFEMRLTWV